MDWRPEAWGNSASIEISDISTNSKSRILFTSFDGREAAGLYGLGPARDLIGTATGEESRGGDAAAAAARSSRPCAAAGAGVKVGSDANTPAIGTAEGEAGGLLDQPAMVSTGVPALVEAHDKREVKVHRELNERAAPRDERLGKWAACLTMLVENHHVWVDWLYEPVGCGYTYVEYTMRVGGVPPNPTREHDLQVGGVPRE